MASFWRGGARTTSTWQEGRQFFVKIAVKGEEKNEVAGRIAAVQELAYDRWNIFAHLALPVHLSTWLQLRRMQMRSLALLSLLCPRPSLDASSPAQLLDTNAGAALPREPACPPDCGMRGNGGSCCCCSSFSVLMVLELGHGRCVPGAMEHGD